MVNRLKHPLVSQLKYHFTQANQEGLSEGLSAAFSFSSDQTC